MIKGYLRNLLLAFGLAFSAPLECLQAIFIQPVSDLSSEKLSLYGIDKLDYYYKHQPLSGDTSRFDCMRTAQALFGEWCEIVHRDIKTHEVAVRFHHFLVDQKGLLEPALFWTLDTNLLILDDETEKIASTIFPKAVSHKDPSSLRNCNYIILTYPFLDEKSKKFYSAGTRFMRLPEKDSDTTFAVEFFEPELGKMVEREVPTHHAWSCDKNNNDQERRTAFVALLKKWCSGNKIIPYVWGGSSFLGTIEDKGFEKVEGIFFDKKINYWERPNVVSPFYGFDCSGLVMRVAQMCGIDYWFKTTSTALRHGVAVQDFKDLENGDLLVWNGHMVVISDKEKGLLIESVGYGSGWGKLHEIALEKRFGNVKMYRDLFELHKNQAELILLYKSGLVQKKISEFKVVSLLGKK